MRDDHHHPRLTAYLDGELPPAAVASAERHLLACPACRRQADDDDAVRRAVAEEPPPLAAGFAARVVARATSRRGPVAPLWWLAVPPAWRLGLAALFVVAVVGGARLGRQPADQARQAERLAATLASPEVVAMRAALPTSGAAVGGRP